MRRESQIKRQQPDKKSKQAVIKRILVVTFYPFYFTFAEKPCLPIKLEIYLQDNSHKTIQKRI